uniref:NADH-ubiquinone oxidoreductase chain 2 n=1 Tax=Lygodactylus aff. angolensis TaxID=2782517 RepID=A0A7U3RWP0_9SAUR|nr:NADH dehydrogenase subunit 2 [Lygodactylus aff. angolensis]
MTPMTWAIMITCMLTSTLIVLSSHHWLLVWLGLELNTLSILPIIIKTHHPRATEATTKYFLIQAAAAALILLSGTLSTWQTGQWTLTYTPSISTTLIMLAAMLKLGLAPVHFWYPDVLQGSTLPTALIISTWQKIAPLTILYLISQTPSTTMLSLGLCSTLIGGWMGLNQTQLRKLLTFSSIAHMGWLIVALSFNPKLATMTLTIYLFTTSAVFLTLILTTMKTSPDLSSTHACHPTLTIALMLLVLSLGGLPPLTGFMPKWLILNELVFQGLILLATLMALASLPSLYFYLRMAYISALTTPPNNPTTEYKWRFKLAPSSALMVLTPLATLLLPMTPTLTNTL